MSSHLAHEGTQRLWALLGHMRQTHADSILFYFLSVLMVPPYNADHPTAVGEVYGTFNCE